MFYARAAHDGRFATHGPGAAPATRWRTSGIGTAQARPTVTDDAVIVGTETHVVALSRDDGAVRWRFGPTGCVYGQPLVHDGTVFVGGFDHAIHAIDLACGAARWSHLAAGWISGSPELVDGRVVVPAHGGKLVALDPADGRVVWRASTGGGDASAVSSADGRLWVASGRKVTMLSARDGKKLASATLDGLKMLRTDPMLADDLVLVGSLDKGLRGTLHALERDTLVRRWSVAFEGQIYGGIARWGDAVIASGGRGAMRGLDLATGAVRWTLPYQELTVHQGFAVADGIAYVGHSFGGGLSAVDAATGEVRWTLRALKDAYTPALADGALYVGGVDALTALS
jgi:outer membrane protein assembly factor BamB